MPFSTRKVPSSQLQTGMYVSGIDCAWEDTPFPQAGFRVESPEQLRQVRNYCEWVLVSNTGKAPLTANRANFDLNSNTASSRETLNLKLRSLQNQTPYGAYVQLDTEMRQARRIHRRLKQRIAKVLSSLIGQRQLNLDNLREISAELVSSVIRNPDAFTYLSRMEAHCEDTLDYSIRVAAWSIITGRHLNLNQEALSDLALAALLSKVGHTTLPQGLTTLKGTPTAHVAELMKWSLLKGVEWLRDSRQFHSRIIKLVSYHQERFDGSGFPRGAQGRQIPFLAQLIGIADCYEGLVSYDFRDKPLSAPDAIRELYHQRDKQFDRSLVEVFIEAIGLYPTGSVVTLNHNRLGLVIGQTNTRLKPKVLLIEAARPFWHLRRRRVLDLNASNEDDYIIAGLPAFYPGQEPWEHEYVRKIGRY